MRPFNQLAAPGFQFWAFSGRGRVIMHKSAKKDKTTRASQMQKDREAYSKLSAGSGSATDSATSGLSSET